MKKDYMVIMTYKPMKKIFINYYKP